ncbi:FAR1 DNA-binding domain [Sesbania bispinosa]|nr:FAR1 DNA-binding domain [Sesbania bispinosa]
MDNLNDELLFQMMQEKDNRSNEGDGENNLKSSNEVTVCSDEDGPDVDKRISELSDEDIRLLEFDSLQDAYDFYSEYAKFKAGERSEKHLNRTDGIREAKAITRTNCLARIRLHMDKDSSKWRVGMFEPDHNHELTPSTMVHLLPKYRGLSVADKAQVNSLHLYGDLYNHIDKENMAKIEDGDAFAALCYLQAKHNELASDYKSTYTQPVLTTALEKSEVGNIVTMKMNKFGSPDSLYVVIYDKVVESIPPSLICKRWTKFANVDQVYAIYNEDGDTSKKEVLRSGAVGAACNRLNKAAHKNPHNFVKNVEDIDHLADQMERQDGADLKIGDISRVVRDPTIVKTKGAPRKSVNHSVHGKSSSGQVQKCNKKAKHDDVVKLTQESVNDRHCGDGTNAHLKQDLNKVIYENRGGNEDFTQMHNDQRVHVVPQYPHIPIQHPFHNSTGYHGMNTFPSHSQNFTTALNEVESKVGLSMKCFNPRDS